MKLTKLNYPTFENIELPNHDLSKDFASTILNSLNKKFEDLVVEGLKKKGFEFENRVELEAFIKSNCRCEENIELNQRIYFIDNTPFLLHYYNSEPPQMITSEAGEYNMTANLGTYAYL